MPKGKGGKGGAAARKRLKEQKGAGANRRTLDYAEDGQSYAVIEKALGNNRFTVACVDEKGAITKRLGILCGRMRKRVWIKVGDWVIAALRDFEDEKCDIVHKYSDDEVRSLQIYGEIPGHGVSDDPVLAGLISDDDDDNADDKDKGDHDARIEFCVDDI